MKNNMTRVGLLICLVLPVLVEAGPDMKAVRQAAELAAGYLARSTAADGRFRYRANLNPEVAYAKDYNLLRHAGTLHAMSVYHRRSPEPQLRSAILRASRFLREQALRPVPHEADMLAVWSLPEVTGADVRQAKLGGTALGLVGLLGVERVASGTTSLAQFRAMGRFLLFMQKRQGDFYSKYIPTEGGRWDAWRSLYYPGEAALGLLMLHERDPEGPWRAAASRALLHIARSRHGDVTVPADHWALLATARLLSQPDARLSSADRGLLLRHAVRVCEVMMRTQVDTARRVQLAGGFSMSGETITTAIYLEGMQAALTFLPLQHPLRVPLEAAVERGVAFLLGAQVRQGDLAGAFPRAVAAGLADGKEIELSDNEASEVRIDYVQHALSALTQFLELSANGAESVLRTSPGES